MSVSVWTGYDTSNRGLRDKNGVGITGGRAAAPIWADFMIKATGGEMERKFPVPVESIARGEAKNFFLQPGDIVYVPESIF